MEGINHPLQAKGTATVIYMYVSWESNTSIGLTCLGSCGVCLIVVVVFTVTGHMSQLLQLAQCPTLTTCLLYTSDAADE